MRRRWRFIPRTALGKTRLAALLFAGAASLPQLLQVRPELPAATRLAGGLALALLPADFAVTYVRRRAAALEPLLVALALCAAGISLREPTTVVGMAVGALATQSLYGSRRTALARTLLVTFALPAAVMLAPVPAGRSSAWHPLAVLGLLPMVGMVGLLMRGLYGSLRRQARTSASDTLLARTGNRLLDRYEVAEVRAIIHETAAALCARAPGVGLLVLRRDGDELVVEGAAGAAPVAARGGEAIDRLAAGWRHRRTLSVPTMDGDRFLLVGGADPVPDEVFDAFQTLATQWSLAEANCGAHRELAHRADHDQLTALPNRRLFFKQLIQAVDAAKGREDSVSLLLLDLDDFKQVNDVYGHPAGDELLIEVAARLTEAGGPGAVPARFGGDEFALLLTGTRAADADQVAAGLLDSLLEPVRLSMATVTIGASIGLASATPTLTAGDLLRCADIAMYSAKARGKNRVERFTEANHGDIAKLRLLEEHLPHAVDRGEIVLHYQPQLDLRSGECVAVEALARWRHPTLGLLPPASFIPLAERSGLIVALGAHVLRSACRQLAAWRRSMGPDAADLRLAVNVSDRQLLEPGFAEVVRDALRDSDLPARLLTIELTESRLVDEAAARSQLRAAAELGVRIAIDDFGSGYASLTSLRSFPVHQLKVDRRLLLQDDEERGHAIFQLVISVGQILDLELVAERVEAPEQATLVRHAGLWLAQGDLFAPPMAAEDFPEWLSGAAAGPHLAASA